MELIVVLVILVALAGVVIPLLPNMLGRAHTSSGATNSSEVTRLVQTYEQLYQGYPNALDNLAGTSAVIDYLPGVAAGQITVGSLQDTEAAALVAAGITRLADLYDTKANLTANGGTPTFNPYKGTFQAVAKGLSVTYLKEAAAEAPTGVVRDEPGNTGDVYVILGLGKQSTAIGKVMSDAPVHFSDDAAGTAANVYGRLGLVFRVARGNGTATPTPLDRAVFVGAVSFHDEGITTTDAHLAEYYSIAKGQ